MKTKVKTGNPDLKNYRGNRYGQKHRNISRLRRRQAKMEVANESPDLERAKRLPLTEDQVAAALCRESFYDFVKEFWSVVVKEKPVWNWHIEYICGVMQRAAERVFAGEPKEFDIAINISPGTSKSTVCSVMFPAWVWTRMASARFICCSHAERLSLTLSRKCRDVVKSDLYRRYFPDVEIRKDQDTKGYFANTLGGERYACGSDGAVMGNHAHFILIDDPIDPKGVLSDLVLESTNSWIEDQLSSRKVDKEITVTALIMQRLHQSDPTAQMLKGNRVKHIKIPAVLEFEVKPAGLRKYYKDGLMDPVRLTRQYLDDIKKKPRGEYIYAGQYGQDPVPPGGGLFKTKNIKFDVPPKKFAKLVRNWDKASVMGGGAYTVGVKMGVDHHGRVWVLDVIRTQLDTFRREVLIKRTAIYDGKSCVIGIEQEPGSGGKESAEATVRRLKGFKVRVLKPGRSKEERSEPFSTQVNAGNVWVSSVTGGKEDWIEVYLDEMRFFPFSTYKDQIDASSGAFTILTTKFIRIGGLKSKERRGLIRHRSRSLQKRGRKMIIRRS